MLLLLDNYDSFTYNLYQYLAELGADVLVRRNDEITPAAAEALAPSHLVISPGPCTPYEAGVSCALIEQLGPRVPTLGVCLGHQCIGQAFGGQIVRAPLPVHGKTASIQHRGAGVLRGLPTPLVATRYHSLIVERASLPPVLEVTAETDDGLIMGLRHRQHPIEGVQFHPESVLTPAGKDLLRNFLTGSRQQVRSPAAVGVASRVVAYDGAPSASDLSNVSTATTGDAGATGAAGSACAPPAALPAGTVSVCRAAAAAGGEL